MDMEISQVDTTKIILIYIHQLDADCERKIYMKMSLRQSKQSNKKRLLFVGDKDFSCSRRKQFW